MINVGGEQSENRNSVLTENGDGTFTAQTLGIRPLPDVVDGLREGSSAHSFGRNQIYSSSKVLKKQGSSHMELKVTVTSAGDAFGVIVAASPDMTEYTTIMYEPSNHTILVDRSHSTRLSKQFNTATVTGYFDPYMVMMGSGEKQEPITMDVFVDGSLVELYMNDRFALTTRIYPSMKCSTGYGIYTATGHDAAFKSVQSWENLLHVWTDSELQTSNCSEFSYDIHPGSAIYGHVTLTFE